MPFFKGRYLGNSENTFAKFLNLLLQDHWANFNQFRHKASLGEGDSRFTNKDHSIFKNEIMCV